MNIHKCTVVINLIIQCCCFIIFTELNHFVIQLDEEVEGMQSTIQTLQQELHQAKKDIAHYKDVIAENEIKLTQYMRAPGDNNNNEDNDYPNENVATTSQARMSYYSEDDDMDSNNKRGDSVSAAARDSADTDARVSGNDAEDREERSSSAYDRDDAVSRNSDDNSHCAPGTPTNDENTRSEYEGEAMDYEAVDEEHLYDEEEEVLTEVESDIVEAKEREDDDDASSSEHDHQSNKAPAERTPLFPADGEVINNQYDDNRTSRNKSPAKQDEMDYRSNAYNTNDTTVRSSSSSAAPGNNRDSKNASRDGRQQHVAATHCKTSTVMNGNSRTTADTSESGDESDADTALINNGGGSRNNGHRSLDANQARTNSNLKYSERPSANGIEKSAAALKTTQQTLVD